MTRNWQKYKLSDLIKVKHGFAFKGEFFSEEPTNDILLTPGNFKIGGGFKTDKFKYYNGHVPTDYILKENDILITMTDLSKAGDTLGYAAKIPSHSDIRYLHNQRLGLVQFKNDNVDKDYLYWLLRTSEYQYYILGSATGSTVKHTSPSRIEDYEFYAPSDLSEQKRIADILSSLDDKIELNNQMNQTLESMAQAIFKEWFVDFKFPGFDGELVDGLPKGWSHSFLGEFTKMISKGTTPTAKEVEGLKKEIKFLKVKDISQDGLIDYSSLERIPTVVHNGRLKRSILFVNDILFSIAGTIGRVAILPKKLENSNCNQALSFIRLNDFKYLEYIHQNLLSEKIQSDVLTKVVQGVQANVSLTVLSNLYILKPSEEVLENWHSTIRPIYNRIQSLNEENENIKELRDSLLPKLMSGKIEVNQ